MGKLDAILKTAKFGLKHGGKFIVKHAPTILTGVGTAGVVAAIILTAKKAPDAKKELDEAKEEWEAVEDKEKRVKADYIFKKIRIGAKHYWGVAVIVGGAIICFWTANRISLKRIMSAVTAASIAAKSKEELEEKIKELDGEKHLQKIKDEIDGDKIKNDPPVMDKIYNTGYGNHLCYEPITGRYFYSNIEKVKLAVIECKKMLLNDQYLSIQDWFNELNIDTTDLHLCWSIEDPNDVNDFDIHFSSQLTSEGIPVLVIQYETNPVMESRNW